MQFDIDVSRLTLAGWALALVSIACGLAVGWAMFPLVHSLQLSPGFGSYLAVLGLAVGFAVPFLVGQFSLGAAGIPILKQPQTSLPPSNPPEEKGS